MAFVDDDDVEGFNRHVRVVFDLDRGGRLDLVSGGLVKFGREFRLPFQDRVHALDSRDAHARDGVNHLGCEMLDVIEFSELAPIVLCCKLLELFESLAAEVCAIHEEEYSAGIGVLDEPIGDVCSGEGLAGTRCHLDESTRPIVTQRLLQVLDRPRLGRPKPGGVQRRHGTYAVPQGRCPWALCDLANPSRKRLRPMEPKQLTTPWLGVGSVGEAGLHAARLVSKRERPDGGC